MSSTADIGERVTAIVDDECYMRFTQEFPEISKLLFMADQPEPHPDTDAALVFWQQWRDGVGLEIKLWEADRSPPR